LKSIENQIQTKKQHL